MSDKTTPLVEQVARRLAIFKDQNPDTKCIANPRDLGSPPDHLDAKPHSGNCVTWVRWRSYIPEAARIIEIVRNGENGT